MTEARPPADHCAAGPAQPHGSQPDRAKRELRLAVLLCLLGSALVLFAASRSWVTFTVEQELTIRRSTTGVSGSDIVPGARALGLVGLAGVVALAATRRWGRVVVGALVLVAGLGVVGVVGAVLRDDLTSGALEAERTGPALQVASGMTHTAWPLACLAGGVVLALAGLLVAVRGRRWAALSSAYEPPVTPSAAPAAAPPAGDKAAWDALDRGDDPTT